MASVDYLNEGASHRWQILRKRSEHGYSLVTPHVQQEAVSGEFDLSKRPTRFAIRNAAPRHGGMSTDPTAIRGKMEATEPKTLHPLGP